MVNVSLFDDFTFDKNFCTVEIAFLYLLYFEFDASLNIFHMRNE